MIRCPLCDFKIDLKAVPGVYQPTCPKCKQPFVVAVPRDEGEPTVARTVDELKIRPVAYAPAKARASAGHAERTAARSSAGLATVAEPPRAAGGDRTMTAASVPRQRVIPVHDESDAGGLPMGRLDGYELIRMLGRGGMGRVYLARQLSLDRLVAVKTIDPDLSRDPAFLARFVREAYAVAQLSHHNVVQIHDICQADDTHFFSMEYVSGQSLTDVVKKHGHLDPEEAATYMLHAARGLKFAHEHNMVHRDVKPSNLLLNDQGLVKVADLGLVKTPGHVGEHEGHAGKAIASDASVTLVASSIGTPAYMAPEQARDAASVDVRADVYALGATFYHMVTGRPPFQGDTIDAVLKQHATAAVVPPERLAPRVPKTLSAMIQRMLAKDPKDRYQTMGEVVAALESHLGVEAGPFTPRHEHSSALELAVNGFNKSPAARVRGGLILAFNLAMVLAAVVGAITGQAMLIGGAICLWLVATVSYQLLSGLVNRSELIRRFRQYLFSFGLRQWLMAAGGVVVTVGVLIFLGLGWFYLGTAVIGVGLAAGFFFAIDLWASRQRKPHVEGVRRMLADMRLRGLEEDALRRFVCRYSGRRWEAFYEALFGYAAKIEARRHWGTDMDGRPRPRHAGWRDSLIEWFEQRQREREETRQRKHLQHVEVQRLRAEGLSDLKAAAEARRTAKELVERARTVRSAVARTKAADGVGKHGRSAGGKAEDIPESWKLQPAPPLTRATTWVLGQPGRFVAGAVLFAIWALWARQTAALPIVPDDGYISYARMYLSDKPAPLQWPGVPKPILNILCSPTAAIAGLILMVSVLFRGRKMTFFLLPAVALLLRAPTVSMAHGTMPSPYEWTILIALAVTLFAFYFGRVRY